MKGRKKYYYEWYAYTCNLCYGRMFLAKGESKAIVSYEARMANKGCFVLEKKRVYLPS